ncbi:nucleotidyltransferase domain-containing protein [Mucilaginibacter sp. UR6-11]|uniref:nucleotidyltransferase domain-containing protein n=1 Tax=Mucilaginibacter sp. UR6-11 TaxID=1435644 RepID=UPI001E2EEB5A|nr:nucleotidyltransferase domain-containing protein [Mucilaginibacter sp. UR6-11]
MNEAKENILATLAYFDIFKYPLTSGEIYLFLKNRYDQPDFELALKCLVASRSVYQFSNFYTLKNDYSLIARRYNGNKKAAELIKIAVRVGDMLIRFPYVRGIAISGSLSKNFADENSDIDLFIITAKNRLWIARTLMHTFKKLTFLVGKQDYFCMNYYIDEEQLEIKEKTIYTAIEVVTLIPLQGDTVIEQFYAANSWTREYLPNKIMRLSSAKPLRPTLFKVLFEKLLNNPVGNAIDSRLMKITAGRWNKKTAQKKLNSKGAIMAMDADKHYAKPDPGNFQARLLEQYKNKMSQILVVPENLLAN